MLFDLGLDPSSWRIYLGNGCSLPLSDLLSRVRDEIRHRHSGYRTEATYVRWVARYVRYHARQLDRFAHELREPQVEAVLHHLAAERTVAASAQTQALFVLLFLYEAVLEDPLDVMGGLRRVRKPPRIPTVLSRREVRALLNQMEGTNGLVAGLLYGAGLRVSGALRLRIKDVELNRRGWNRFRKRFGINSLCRKGFPSPSTGDESIARR